MENTQTSSFAVDFASLLPGTCSQNLSVHASAVEAGTISAWNNPPKIRTLVLKSFPNTQCLLKYSPGQKIRETNTLPADVLRNHLIVITSTKKGNEASVTIIFTKKKKTKPIPSPCSEQILSISYTQHKTTLQSAIYFKTSLIDTANRQLQLLKTLNKSETKNPSKTIHLQELRKYPQSVSQRQP